MSKFGDFAEKYGGPITAAAGLIGSIGSGRKAYHRSKKLMDKQFQMDIDAWRMQNAYNTPEAQQARLKAAGLNPALMYGQGTVGNATGQPQSKFTQLQPYMSAGDMGSMANTAIQGMLAKANKDLLKSQMFKNISSSKLDNTNRFKINSLLGLEMDKMKSEIQFTKANTRTRTLARTRAKTIAITKKGAITIQKTNNNDTNNKNNNKNKNKNNNKNNKNNNKWKTKTNNKTDNNNNNENNKNNGNNTNNDNNNNKNKHKNKNNNNNKKTKNNDKNDNDNNKNNT